MPGIENPNQLNLLPYQMFFCSTYSIVYSSKQLVLINFLRAIDALLLVIKSAGLLLLLIHLTSVISLHLYNQWRHMISIIRRFFCIVPSLIRYLQSKFKSVQSISGSLICRIYLMVDLIIAPILNLQAIIQSFEASTLLVTLLYLVNDQWIILALYSKSSRTKIYPICNKRSLLLVNKALVKTSRYSILISNLINIRPLIRLLIYNYSYLLSTITSSFLGLITWAAKERLKETSS